MKYILCVGDSLTFGARDEYHSSYPAQLARVYWSREQKNVYCVNHGISGETSGQLLRRIYSNSRSCLQAELALLLIGTNDTFLPQRLELYAENLRQIVTVLKADRPHVGIGFLPPIVGPGLPNYPRDGQRQVDSFNEIIGGLASQHGLFTADFRGFDRYIIDTVHMNHAGYEAMASVWYEAIRGSGISL